jgi:hypothetical protein
MEESGDNSDGLNNCTGCTKLGGFSVSIGDRVLMKLKIGESCRCEMK